MFPDASVALTFTPGAPTKTAMAPASPKSILFNFLEQNHTIICSNMEWSASIPIGCIDVDAGQLQEFS